MENILHFGVNGRLPQFQTKADPSVAIAGLKNPGNINITSFFVFWSVTSQ